MLDVIITSDSFVFSIRENGEAIDFSTWLENGYSQFFGPLQELADNGFAEIRFSEVVVPFVGVYELDRYDREAFGLPSIYPFDVYVAPKGIITRNNFGYEYSFRTFAPAGEIMQLVSKTGPIVRLRLRDVEQDYLLSKDEFLLLDAIDEYNSVPDAEKTANGNLVSFSHIKSLSEDAAIVLDSVLAGKSVIVPEHIKLDFNYHGGVLEIKPTVEGDNDGKFVQMVDGFDEVRDNYPFFNSDGTKTHVVLNDEQKEAVSEIKEKYRRVTDQKTIEEIVDNPAKFFDLDVVDVSELYSDRVIEIGLYQPKFYQFVSPYKSQWIPVFKVEDRVNGTTTLAFKDYGELSRFETAIHEAEDGGSTSVSYKGATLGLGQAKDMAEKARRQLDNKDKSPEETHKNKQEVLIIKENTEETEYPETSKPWEMPERLELEEDEFLDSTYSLKKHQKEGVAWFQCLMNNDLKGCLLADDMGMGKTLQVMYAIDWHSRKSGNEKPYLVVAPVSLLENWENEYEKYFSSPRLKVLPVTAAPKEYDKAFVDKLSKQQIVLTSYETMRRAQLNFCAVDFAIAVLDEAQRIKTPGAMVTNAAKALKSDFKIAMTGTPVENTFVDLWCIIDFVKPGLLGNAKEFARQYQAPLKKENVNIDALGEEIRKKIDGFFMRRMKDLISSELPDKIEEEVREEMPPVQYQRYVAALRNISGDNMLLGIFRIRALADHPCLDGDDVSRYSDEEIINNSAKMKATFRILDDIRNKGEKAIIFTEKKEMQRILQRSVLYKYGICPRVVNGETASVAKRSDVETRQRAIDSFQSTEGFNVIIMSPLATGMGLNVTGANHVIHYSRHWNPAKEMQATDRAYRIGQTKDVHVYYPMAVCDEFNTFDVILNELLHRKIHLATSSLYPTEMIEIGKQEMFDELTKNQKREESQTLTVEDVNNMDDFYFESYIGALYEKAGYQVSLTSRSGDKGVDVIALGQNGNYAIQCKHSKNNVGVSCVQEIQTGAKYYESIFGKALKPVAWATSMFTNDAKDLAGNVDVKCMDGGDLKQWMSQWQVTWDDVYRMENKRMR